MPNSTTIPFRWIDSTSWELDFFGLPHRIPWPANIDPAVANRDPFEMEHLLQAIEAMGSEAGEPWTTFQRAAQHLDDFAEALEGSEIVHAYEQLEAFDELHPDTAFALFHRGSLARLEGQDGDAVSFFEAAAEKTPNAAPIWTSLGVVQGMRGERDAAVAAFRKALAIAPQDRTALEGLAQLRELVKLLRNAKDPNSAIFMELPTFRQMAAKQIQQLAGNADQSLNYGEQLMREGFAPDEGLQALRQAHALRPTDARTVFALTSGYRFKGDLGAARATITPYTEAQPNDPQGFFLLAQVCNAAEDEDGEDRALDRVLEIDPNAQAAIGIRFGLGAEEHDPANEQKLAEFGAARGSWMAYVLAGNVARQRGDPKTAVKWAERAYALAPESEDVLLHYTAALGEARDFEKLVSVIKPQVESGKFTKRLNWNYAQVLQQLSLTDDAIRVLREAATGEVPPDFKAAVETTIEAWTGELTGCGVQLEVHRTGFLQRPVLLVVDGDEGGVVLNAGAQLPVTGSFPWRATAAEVRVALQQGEAGGSVEPRGLGAFIVQGIREIARQPVTIDCHLAARPDGALHFRATQDGRKLKVGWAPVGLQR
jgi:tetratricopeptide (TPR) repeat protein